MGGAGPLPRFTAPRSRPIGASLPRNSGELGPLSTATSPSVVRSVFASHTLYGVPAAARAARHIIRAALGSGHSRMDAAVLVTSELVSNAVLHTLSGAHGGEVCLRVTVNTAAVRIDVSDAGTLERMPPGPVELPPSLDQEHGRGLALVAHLSDAWGTALHTSGRRTTWASWDNR
nr:ATP-binding protein [Nocardiopsis trehalosi]